MNDESGRWYACCSNFLVHVWRTLIPNSDHAIHLAESSHSKQTTTHHHCRHDSSSMSTTVSTSTQTTTSTNSNDSSSQSSSSIVYLNNAGMALLHPDVQAIGARAMADPFSVPADTVTAVRTHFATLIDTTPNCVAMAPSTAFAITLAAQNLERTVFQKKSHGKILVLMDQFNSAVYPWQDVCDRSDGRLTLEIVPHSRDDAPSTWTDRILERLSDNVVVAACLPPLVWSDGASIDLVRIGHQCQSLEIPLVVDATQAIGAVADCSVRNIQPCFLACSSHKWLRGPSGVSLMYIDPALHDTWEPLDQHGRGRDMERDWDAGRDTMGPQGYPTVFVKDARKFDSGGKPNHIILPMLRTSLERVVQLDRCQLQVNLQRLWQPLLDWAVASGKYTVPEAPHVYHLVGLRPTTTVTPEQMIAACRGWQTERGIYVAVRCGCFRISPYVDTTSDDIEKLRVALEEF